MNTKNRGLHSKIGNYIASLSIETISDDRRIILKSVVDYVQKRLDKGEDIRLNFICTHNSRRSHLSQIWAQTMAFYFNIDKVNCYSAGTEDTAVYPMIIKTLVNTGFTVDVLAKTDNPIYSIKYANNQHPIIGFSKKIEHPFNPSSQFAAVMTCSQADVGCPYIMGADQRIPMTFEDPKVFDNTPNQAKKYEERSQQIAVEMIYIFSEIKNK